MRVVLRLSWVVLTAAACSLSGPDGEARPLTDLSEAWARWLASGISDYELTMRRSCGECLPTSALHVVVSVRDGMKTVTRADNGVLVEALPQTYPDVVGLLELIEEMLLAGAVVEAEYDADLGFPRTVSIDPVPEAVDDEFGYVVEGLRVGRHAELRAELAAQHTKWSASGIANYQLTLRRSCFCGPGAAGIVIINVLDREPLEWHYFLTGEPVPAELQRLYPGVEGLFEFLEEAIDRGAESIEVTFDPELGLPQEVFVDFRLAAADEEIAYVVEKVLPFDGEEEPTPAPGTAR